MDAVCSECAQKFAEGKPLTAPDRVRLRGPRALIPPDLATPFGLVFHELATNAAKYGALSGDDGKVELTWEIEEHDGRRRLQVRWEEREGPRVETTAAQGSGRRLIESGIPGARVDLKMQHDGCVCTIEIDLAGDALDDTGA